MIELLSTGAMGLAIGVRHAVDPDHLAAVSTLLTHDNRARRGALTGALWGLGHALPLLTLGVALALTPLQVQDAVLGMCELGVGFMLLGLGGNAVRRAIHQGRRGTLASHSHFGRGHTHTHHGPAAHVHLGEVTLAARPLFVGIAHGLAGTGSVALLAVASQPPSAARFLFLVLFACGSTLGMSLLTGLAALPLSRLRGSRAQVVVLWAAGLSSVGVGLLWIARQL